jgi:hypothetical protein
VNTIAIDPNFRGDWLAPEPANYVAARDLGTSAAKPPCDFVYLGGNFFGSAAAIAWKGLVEGNVQFVITIDPGVHAVPVNVYNEALTPENFAILWKNLNDSGLFVREPAPAGDDGIAVFRRKGAPPT